MHRWFQWPRPMMIPAARARLISLWPSVSRGARVAVSFGSSPTTLTLISFFIHAYTEYRNETWQGDIMGQLSEMKQAIHANIDGVEKILNALKAIFDALVSYGDRGFILAMIFGFAILAFLVSTLLKASG